MTKTVTSVSALQTRVEPRAAQTPWYQRSEDQARDLPGTTLAGLGQPDATARRARYWPNGLDESPHRSPLAFAAQFPGIMIVMLIAAVLTSCETVQSQSSPQAWGTGAVDAAAVAGRATANVEPDRIFFASVPARRTRR